MTPDRAQRPDQNASRGSRAVLTPYEGLAKRCHRPPDGQTAGLLVFLHERAAVQNDRGHDAAPGQNPSSWLSVGVDAHPLELAILHNATQSMPIFATFARPAAAGNARGRGSLRIVGVKSPAGSARDLRILVPSRRPRIRDRRKKRPNTERSELRRYWEGAPGIFRDVVRGVLASSQIVPARRRPRHPVQTGRLTR